MIYRNDVLFWHQMSIAKYGGSLGIRDEGMLESAIERPNASFGGIDLYPSPFQKAASIFESIVKNHPFVDGNKRTGLLAGAGLLLTYDFELVASEKQSFDFVLKVASSYIDFDEIVSFFEQNSIRI